MSTLAILGLFSLVLAGGLFSGSDDADDDATEEPVTPDDPNEPEMAFDPLGASLFLGTDADDSIGNANGDDTIFGGAGNDTIAAPFGDGNELNGEAGNDSIVSFGNSTINGGAGDDDLTGAGSINTGTGLINADAGNDTIRYGNNVEAFGGAGDDVFLTRNDGISSSGAATLNGGSGDDTIGIGTTIYTSPDEGALRSFIGGDGSDTFQVSLDSANGDTGLIGTIEDFDPGTDVLVLEVLSDPSPESTNQLELAGVNLQEVDDASHTDLRLTLSSPRGDAAVEAIIRIAGVTGLSLDDLNFVLPDGSALSSGFTDIDGTADVEATLAAESYNNFGAGNDSVTSDQNGTFVSLGDGEDVFLGRTEENNIVLGGLGNDTLETGGDGAVLSGGLDNDVLISNGDNSTLHGGSGDDTLITTGDGIFLSGGAGSDVYLAEEGSGSDVTFFEFFETGVTDSFTLRAGQTAIGGNGNFTVNITAAEAARGPAFVEGSGEITLNADPMLTGEFSVITRNFEDPLREPLSESSVFIGETLVLVINTGGFQEGFDTFEENPFFDFTLNRGQSV